MTDLCCSFYSLQTVQTSSPWRPPMPLPDERKQQDSEKNHHQQQRTNNNINTVPQSGEKKDTMSASKEKKWSIGGLFRRKKKTVECGSSSEEDYAENGGFPVQKRTPKTGKDNSKRSSKRSSKLGAFDHIVIVPNNQEVIMDPNNYYYNKTGSLDRMRPKNVLLKEPKMGYGSSDNEDEFFMVPTSSNSGSMSRFRSDDSLMTNQSNSTISNRKTRAARTERYLKRRSKDGEGPSPIFVGQPLYQNQQYQQPQPQQQQYISQNRWKTQPIMPHGSSQSLMMTSTPPAQLQYRPNHPLALQNSSSLTHVPIMVHPVMNYSRDSSTSKIHPDRRSFSYDNYINKFSLPKSSLYQNQSQTTPPPPPPRDPMRRLTVGANLGAPESRPVSYAFDKQNESNYRNLNQKCVSEDQLWNQNQYMMNTQNQMPQQQHQQYVGRPSSAQPEQHSSPMTRRFITRPNNQPQTPPHQDQKAFKYVTDATPRSRKPIHILEDFQGNNMTVTSPDRVGTRNEVPRNQTRSATDFWKKIDQNSMKQQDVVKPKVIKPKATLTLQKSEDYGLNSSPQAKTYRFDVPVPQSCDGVFETSTQGLNEAWRFKPVNRYEEHIAKNMGIPQSNQSRKTKLTSDSPTIKPYSALVTSAPVIQPYQSNIMTTSAPQVNHYPIKKSASQDVVDSRKSKKLEEAINELEAIYKSLKLSDDELLDRAEKRDITTPTGFSKKMKTYQFDDEDDEDSPKKEPDIILDDVAYRNLKHANNFPKIVDAQPPFGIPVGPIPPPSNLDYLKVSGGVNKGSLDKLNGDSRESPDLITDDLAVRSLRKDNGQILNKLDHYMNPLLAKKKATRSQSANIYNLIQRDATKPSGGCLDDYDVFDKLSKKLINLTDGDSESDNITKGYKSREMRHKTLNSFLTPTSTNGAVFNLPSTLSPSQQKPPIPTPRKSLSPYLKDIFSDETSLEDLNKLVMDAKLTSVKLSQDLDELRKEAKVKAPLEAEVARNQRQENKIARIPLDTEVGKNKKQEIIVEKTPLETESVRSQRQDTKVVKMPLETEVVKSQRQENKIANVPLESDMTRNKNQNTKEVKIPLKSEVVKAEVTTIKPIPIKPESPKIVKKDLPQSPLNLLRKIQNSEKSTEPKAFSPYRKEKSEIMDSKVSSPKAQRSTEKFVEHKAVSPKLIKNVEKSPEIKVVSPKITKNSERISEPKLMSPVRSLRDKSVEINASSKSSKEKSLEPKMISPKPSKKSLTDKNKLLNDINMASKAVKACEQMLVDVVQDTPRQMLQDKRLLNDINEVSLAMKGCEQILKGVVPIEAQSDSELTEKSSPDRQSVKSKSSSSSATVKNQEVCLEKEKSKITELSSRCLKQISVLEETAKSGSVIRNNDEATGDYDNLQEKVMVEKEEKNKKVKPEIGEGEKIVLKKIDCPPEIEREINEMMKACSEVMEKEENEAKKTEKQEESVSKSRSKTRSPHAEDSPPYSTPIDEFSSPMKSSSATPNNNFLKSSSLTSFHAFSSSDYLKSPSSENCHNSNFDNLIKSNSTTSYDVKSTTTASSNNNSDETLSPANVEEPKPRDVVDSPKTVAVQKNKLLGGCPAVVPDLKDPTDSSQYNSSEELAMIFGIKQASVTPPTGNQISFSDWNELENSDDFEIDRNNNSVNAINNNYFADDNTATDAVAGVAAVPKSGCVPTKPKMHGISNYFGPKKSELEIIFENPHEILAEVSDPELEELEDLVRRGGSSKYNSEIVIYNGETEEEIKFRSELNLSVEKQFTNELSIDVGSGVVEKKPETIVNGQGNKSESCTEQEDRVCPAPEPSATRNLVADKLSNNSCRQNEPSTSRGVDDHKSQQPRSSSSLVNSLRNRFTGSSNSGKADSVRRNLIHPEHFLLASLSLQGLSNYDEVLTVLAILIAIITLIALVFL